MNQPEIDVTISAGDWTEIMPDHETICRNAVLATLAGTKNKLSLNRLEVSLLLTNDNNIRLLNHQYRGHDSPTNVLSFAAMDMMSPQPPDAPILLGDVILSLETAQREATAEGKNLVQHITHLVIHGILHLLGYDHHLEEEATVMENIESCIMKKLGYPNPYHVLSTENRI